MARKNLNKPIVETDKPGGKTIKYWRSAKSAADFYGFSQQVIISYNVNGITKQAKGHYFRFATKQEIEDYEVILRRLAAAQSTDPAPIVPELTPEATPIETIPEVVQKADNQTDAISPFDRLLQESKKKFTENSD